MFAIAFDMVIADLEKHYGQPYNNAYFEIGKVLRKFDFYNAQGSVYMTQNRDMSNLFRAMGALKSINWFRLSVRDIKAFRVEDWSNFTDYMKEDFVF
jgi:virulence-associated protein VapD